MAAGLAALLTLAVAAPAPAATAAYAAPCAPRAFTTIFSAFRDTSLYTLAPDGGFEAGATGWTLAGGGFVAADSSTIKLGPTLGARSVQLGVGASATSPAICVERGFSSFRFVARSVGAVPGAVRVEVLHASGRVAAGGAIKPGAAWGVTPKVNLVEGLFNIQAGASTTVRLKFTASGGPVRIDDVYVDPRYRG